MPQPRLPARLAFVLFVVGAFVSVAPPADASNGDGTVRGVVFVDTDGDGEPDPGEETLGGVSLTFKSGDDSHTATTADDGSFSIDLGVGTWSVSVSPPEGYQVSQAPEEVRIGSAGAVVPDVNVAMVASTQEGGKALPASGSGVTPTLAVSVFGLLFGMGFGLWMAGRSRSARAN